jgi:uncharacterized protein (DUF362 family)
MTIKTPEGKVDLSRRKFLTNSLKASLLFTPNIFPFISSCSSKSSSIPTFSSQIKEVKRILANTQTRENPIAICWDPGINSYPSIWNIEGYFRENNPVYPLVEKVLMLLNRENPENPLTNLINKGDVVVIKPNWCTERRFPMPITHPSIILPIIEYCIKAGAKEIRIVEAPMTLNLSQKFFWGKGFLNIVGIIDILSKKYPQTIIKFQDGNDDDFCWVDLGVHSNLSDYQIENLTCNGDVGLLHNMFFDVKDYKGFNPKKYKTGLYAVAKSFLDCDVFINVPKLKTHLWSGLTIALKNLMGITLRSTSHFLSSESLKFYTQKENLKKYRESGMRDVPHFDKSKYAIDKLKAIGFENDVLWRSLADLNKIMIYVSKDGILRNTPQRKYLNIVDGIVGTDRDGPISTSIVRSNVIIGGVDPVKVDSACCRIMGWNPKMIKLIENLSKIKDFKLGEYFDIDKDLIGIPKNSRAFNQFYIPPVTYSDKMIAPFSVKV